MTDESRETRVLGAVVSLVDSLLDDFDVVDLLTELTERCVQLLDVASAGLLLTDARRGLHLVAATSARTREVELLQLHTDEGPCVDCFTSGEPVSVADLEDASARWPHFVAAATAAGFASVHAVPVRTADTVLGAVGLFGTATGDLDDADQLVAQTLAHVACVAILRERAPAADTVAPRLHSVLNERIVVEQATGFLRDRLDVTLSEAFELLRTYARRRGAHLGEVCRQLITDPAARPAIVSSLLAHRSRTPSP
jgi:transcriptional regulator with GAF, ATPase, and Fis domain